MVMEMVLRSCWRVKESRWWSEWVKLAGAHRPGRGTGWLLSWRRKRERRRKRNERERERGRERNIYRTYIREWGSL